MTLKELEKKIQEINDEVNELYELKDELEKRLKKITGLVDDIPDPIELDEEE